jgi:hypothetical protein
LDEGFGVDLVVEGRPEEEDKVGVVLEKLSLHTRYQELKRLPCLLYKSKVKNIVGCNKRLTLGEEDLGFEEDGVDFVLIVLALGENI